MLTNSILGIAQQLVVEQVAPRSKDGDKGIVVKQKGDKPGGGGDNKKSLGDGFGKGKARV